jgi:hypothetical protein
MLIEPNSTTNLFSADELTDLEKRYVLGISSQEIITLFQERGVKLSEATFRKYVQLGLLPTSRRVGRKGKHRGSRGVYPVSVMRRINLVKRMMLENMTLEEIRDSFLSIQNEMERFSEVLERVFSLVGDRISRLNLQQEAEKSLLRDLEKTRQDARMLTKALERIGSRLAMAGSPSIS